MLFIYASKRQHIWFQDSCSAAIHSVDNHGVDKPGALNHSVDKPGAPDHGVDKPGAPNHGAGSHGVDKPGAP